MAQILSQIALFAAEKGITIAELERKLGASKGVLSRATANGTDVQSKWMARMVAEFSDLSAEWLLRGTGGMYLSDHEPPRPVGAENCIITGGEVIGSTRPGAGGIGARCSAISGGRVIGDHLQTLNPAATAAKQLAALRTDVAELRAALAAQSAALHNFLSAFAELQEFSEAASAWRHLSDN